jgi:eukaryotic-like serine/threonine-protein kinase
VAEHDPMVGRTLEGRYTIIARLGSGSMGTVYRARQHAMGREVAIKILRGDRAIDDNAKARFLREARANSLLASPNTVTVFDFGQSESGEFYLAMELLEGESLGQRLTRVGRLPIPVAVDAARQALRSLSEAHAKGIIHRDLKPDNLFFARVLTSASAPGDHHEEIVKVLDFGIAKMVRDGDEPMGVVETQAGTVFGTPRYMSPEQAQGKTLDPRTDLYSLGVIVYQMLTGRPPFTDNDAVVVMARHIKSIPRRPNDVNPEANIPKELEDVVMRALSKDPAERQASADVLAGELLAALEAQGATTSGVRASVTNVAGIRVPDSMRPPPVSLPPPRSTKKTLGGVPIALVAAALPVIVLVAASGVYLGMRSGTAPVPPRPLPTATATTAAAAAATTTAAATAAMTTAATVTTSEPPTVTPDALPKAQPTTPQASKALPPHVGKGARLPKGAASAKGPNGAAAASTSTSNYGVFE